MAYKRNDDKIHARILPKLSLIILLFIQEKKMKLTSRDFSFLFKQLNMLIQHNKTTEECSTYPVKSCVPIQVYDITSSAEGKGFKRIEKAIYIHKHWHSFLSNTTLLHAFSQRLA